MSNFLSVGSVEKIAKDVLTGNVAKAGKSFATSVAVESPENSV